MMITKAFWIDYEYDADHANRANGSRYFDYITDRAGSFEDCWDWEEVPKARFAATAWRIATGPIMVPGYVRIHPRILNVDLERSDWDGSLLGCVDLITPPPHALQGSSEWGGGKWWRSWPSESLSSREAYYYPSGEDLAKDPYILPSVSLRFLIPDDRVLAPPADHPSLPELQHAAKHCVTALVGELNATITPVIEKLERSLWTRPTRPTRQTRHPRPSRPASSQPARKKLAADIRALHQQWQETAGESVRPALFRADEAAGGVNHAAEELTATAADLDRIAAAGAADICSIPWGVCPDHGATLAASGTQSWCTRCGRGWHYDRYGLPCTEPTRWTWTDTEGATAEICDGHAIAIRTDLPGANLTPLTAGAGGR